MTRSHSSSIDRRRPPSPSRKGFVNTVRGTTLPEISFDFTPADDVSFFQFYEGETGPSPGGGATATRRSQSGGSDSEESHSSVLTDEEAQVTSNENGTERIIREVCSQKERENYTADGVETGLCEVLRKEFRPAVEVVKTEIEQGMMNVDRSDANDASLQLKSLNVPQAVSVIQKNYAAKLKKSEMCKQELLAEIVAEEQRHQELSKVVKKLLPDPKNTAVQEKSSCATKNTNNSSKSNSLIEDAEKCFDEFLSNIESMDVSSFDGETNDANSTIRVSSKEFGENQTAEFSTRSTSCPVETNFDGVVLPWLQWETNHEAFPSLCKNKAAKPLILEDNSCCSAQGESTRYNGSNIFNESRLSSGSGGGSRSIFSLDDTNNECLDHGNYHCQPSSRGHRNLYFDVEEYLQDGQNEEIIFEAWRQQQGISSDALLLCNRTCIQL